ncbi:monooxygenase [Armillaria mellea]|nr:monooxygenase [Armillaria mellea]
MAGTRVGPSSQWQGAVRASSHVGSMPTRQSHHREDIRKRSRLQCTYQRIRNMAPAIAIIGAGPSGLLLARLLQHLANIPSTIFELDPSPSARGQGGTLDIHEESGQRALKRAGLFSEFQKLMRPEGECMRLADKTGFMHIDEETPGEGRPEIDRAQLRQILVDSVPDKSIEWSSKVASVQPTPDGRFRIIFANGSEDSRNFDFVVGADGTWSRVRPLVTDALPFYSGISSVEVHFPNVDKAHPEISKLVGQGSYMCLSDEKGCFAQRQGDGSIRNYAMLRVPESWIDDCGIDFSNPQATKAEMVERYFGDWSEVNKDLIRLADEEHITARKLMMLPVDHRWTSRPGVTLMGDAAHVMTPFAGEGVNNAMVDALELAEKVVAALGDDSAGNTQEKLAKAVKEYEEGMFPRVHGIAQETLRNLTIFFSKNAALGAKEMMEGYRVGHRDV